jgi:hypothetical protein
MANHDPSGTLNVILHGSFAFMLNDDSSVDALIPTDTDHAIRAGNWLGETQLAPGEYFLRVDAAPAPVARKYPEHNLIIDRPRRAGMRADGKGDLYAIVHLPRPRKIASLNRANLKFNQNFAGRFFTDGFLNQPQAKEIATLQVFTYDVANDAAVVLEGHFWEPAFTGDSRTINLHIFSAHETEPAVGHDTHVTDSFEKCARLFNGVDLRLQDPTPVSEIGETVDGVLDEEKEDLEPRTRRLARLGRLQKAKKLDFISQVWFDFDPVDFNPSACGGPWGGP